MVILNSSLFFWACLLCVLNANFCNAFFERLDKHKTK